MYNNNNNNNEVSLLASRVHVLDAARLSSASGDARETSFLFQRLSVVIHRFNSVLIKESFGDPEPEPDL